MKKAIIVGCEGQDGRLLYDLLIGMNYSLLGIGKNVIRSDGIKWDKIVDISIKENVFDLLKTIKPREIYYLAAFHHSSEDKPIDNYELYQQSYNVNLFYLINFLEAIRLYSPETRLFYAASSLIFGKCETEIQDENTPFNPDTVYGITKLDGLLICRFYRNEYEIFASTGILYNHESHLRKVNFISKKIIKGAINVKNKKQDKIYLGDLTAEIDWGYAPDYVKGMHKILNSPTADEYIVATGTKHSVRDFVRITFEYLNLDWQHYVKENKNIITRKRNVLIGNPMKLKKVTGWQPAVDFKGMIKILLKKEGAEINER
jgi:GDPmannose 4,6-dehydratase